MIFSSVVIGVPAIILSALRPEQPPQQIALVIIASAEAAILQIIFFFISFDSILLYAFITALVFCLSAADPAPACKIRH